MLIFISSQLGYGQNTFSAFSEHSANDTSFNWTIGKIFFIPNNDTNNINKLFPIETVQVQELYTQVEDLVFFPNPVKDHFNIIFPKKFSSDFIIELRDMFGRLLRTSKFNSKEGIYSVKFSNYQTGIYFITFKSQNKNVFEPIKLYKN